MPTLTLNYQDENERLMIEQAVAYVTQLQKLAMTAAEGTVLDACEKLALDDGRKLLRSALAAALQSRVAEAEKKGARAPVPRSAPRTS